MASRGKFETEKLIKNVEDQLNRLLMQLEDLEELKYVPPRRQLQLLATIMHHQYTMPMPMPISGSMSMSMPMPISVPTTELLM
jgi:hypothetical protein